MGLIRACLVCELKLTFSHFKQRYTYFHTLFHPHIFQKTLNNSSQTALPTPSFHKIKKCLTASINGYNKASLLWLRVKQGSTPVHYLQTTEEEGSRGKNADTQHLQKRRERAIKT